MGLHSDPECNRRPFESLPSWAESLKCPENKLQTLRGRDLSGPASCVNSSVASFEPVALSSPNATLLEPRVRVFLYRACPFPRLASAKAPEITAIVDFLSPT